jgi:hypothetical protein
MSQDTDCAAWLELVKYNLDVARASRSFYTSHVKATSGLSEILRPAQKPVETAIQLPGETSAAILFITAYIHCLSGQKMMKPIMTSAASVNDSRTSPGAQSRRPWLQTSLDTARSCIRILKLRKGSGVMPIIGDLNVASLDDHPPYEAVSYTWGDPTITEAIIIGHVTFLATKNLFDFLNVLRSPTADKLLWVDAICIDQTNEEEKIYQIGLMTTIYKCAVEVHIWFGAFTSDWEREIKDSENYTPMAEMTPEKWKDYETFCLGRLKYFEKEDGFKPLSRVEFEDFKRCCLDDILLQTLTMLDRIADADGREHHYTYPVFVFLGNEQGSDQKYGVNSFWVLVLDCIRWLLTRPWWTRVWTLQEAVLPRIDPTVHASPYSFKLSRLLNGIHAMVEHNNSLCCKWVGGVILTKHRDYGNDDLYVQPRAIHKQRESLKDLDQEGIPLEYVINSIQGRKATEIRDHWFGIFGLLSPHWQEEDQNCTEVSTTAELFTKCSKLLYSNCRDLTRLDLARRLRESKIPDLPSWAIDLSAQRTNDQIDYERWVLYDAAPGTAFDGAQEWPELKTPGLTVQAIRVGTVFTLGEWIPLNSTKGRGREQTVLKHVEGWRKLYRENVRYTNDDDAFWRAIFMDRDRLRHWLHKRTSPLYGSRLTDINEWFHNWKRTGDEHDLDTDNRVGGSRRGFYHYMALEMNVKKTRFFIMADGLPGMGPHDVQAGDEVYVVAGSKSLFVLRQRKWNGMDCCTFVGLCFVNGWMYGRAMQGNPIWESLQLF